MCYAVESYDSRYAERPVGGWYCCRDLTFNKGKACRVCKKPRDNAGQPPVVVPKPKKRKKA